MTETVNGFKVDLLVNGTEKESMVVLLDYTNDDETNVATIASVAARYGYPEGTIDVVSFEKGRFTPFGLFANPEHSAIWVN